MSRRLRRNVDRKGGRERRGALSLQRLRAMDFAHRSCRSGHLHRPRVSGPFTNLMLGLPNTGRVRMGICLPRHHNPRGMARSRRRRSLRTWTQADSQCWADSLAAVSDWPGQRPPTFTGAHSARSPCYLTERITSCLGRWGAQPPGVGRGHSRSVGMTEAAPDCSETASDLLLFGRADRI